MKRKQLLPKFASFIAFLFVAAPWAAADFVLDGVYVNPAARQIQELALYKLVLERDHFDATQTDYTDAGKADWYTTDNRSAITTGFSRLAYYLEITTGTGAAAQTEWVLTTLPDYTSGNLGKAGFSSGKVDALKFTFQKQVSDMNVYISADSGKYNISLLKNAPDTTYTNSLNGSQTFKTLTGQAGVLEIWPSGYVTGAKLSDVKGSNGSAYDYNDSGFDTGDGHNSFQFHLYDATPGSETGQTLLAINHVTYSDLQMGIGHNNSGNGSPDWTFNTTTRNAASKLLQVFAMPSYADNSFIWNGGEGTWGADGTNWLTWNSTTEAATVATTAPQSSSPVFINYGAVTLEAGSTAAIGSLAIASGTTLTVPSGTALTIADTFSADDGTVLNLGGTITVSASLPVTTQILGANAQIINSSSTKTVDLNNIRFDSAATPPTALSLTGAFAFSPAATESIAVPTALSGTGTVTQGGTGAVVLSGDNSGYTGTWTVSSGSLDLQTVASQPKNLSVQSGAALTVVLGGANGYTEAQFNALAGSSALQSGAYLGITAQSEVALTTALSSGLNFAKSGLGTLLINNSTNSAFNGATKVYQGALQIGDAANEGAFGGTINVADGAQVVFNQAASADKTRVMNNAISGNGTLVVEGGTLKYTSATPKNSNGSWLDVDTDIQSGSTLFFDDTVTPLNRNDITINIQTGGVLELYNKSNTSGNHGTNSALFYGGTTDLPGGSITLTGSGKIVKTGTGTNSLMQSPLDVGKGGDSIEMIVAMDAGAWFDIQEGTFVKGGWGSRIQWTNNKASINVRSGALLNLWDGPAAFDSLTGAGTVRPNGESLTLTLGQADNANAAEYAAGSDNFNVTGNTATFSGNINSNPDNNKFLQITKVGSGKQILGGQNTLGAVTVSKGTLQFGLGTETTTSVMGNVLVASGANLIYNTTADSTISTVVSGSGTITQAQNATLALTNAANSFYGTVNINKGTLQLGSATTNGTLGYGAAVAMGDNTALDYYVASGTQDTRFSATGSNYTLNKFGAGNLELKQAVAPTRINLNEGAVSVESADQLVSTPIVVKGDSTLFAPIARNASVVDTPTPWAITLYKGSENNASYAQIKPSDPLKGVTVYTDMNAFHEGSVSTAWNMDQCANNISNTDVRNYLPTYSTISYTANVNISEQVKLQMVGYFDDRSGIFIYPLNADGTPDYTKTAYSMNYTGGFGSSATVTIPAGLYQIDARVGDIGGNALASGSSYYDADNSTKKLGLGMRIEGTATGNNYYPLTIDETTGNLAGMGDKITSVGLAYTSIETSINLNNLTIDEGKTLTIDNPNANGPVLTVNATAIGAGTLKIANSTGNADMIAKFKGTTEGDLIFTDEVNNVLLDTTRIGGDLVFGAGTEIDIEQADTLVIGGQLTADGSTLNLTANVDSPSIEAAGASLDGLTINALYTGDISELTVINLIEAADGTALTDFESVSVNIMSNNPELRFAIEASAGAIHAKVGDASSIPEPSSWLLLALGLVAFLGRFFKVRTK